MARSLLLCAALASLLGIVTPAPAEAVEPRRSDQESFIRRAVFAEGRLWMLSDAGVLSSVAENDERRTEEALPERAIDLCVADGAPAVLTGAGEQPKLWTLRRRSGGAWKVVAQASRRGDSPFALTCDAGRVNLLTSRRLIDLTDGRADAVDLEGKIHWGLVASVQADRDALLVGSDAGEWGGGLHRVDRETGVVTTIEKNDSGELCGGPLNTECDPVNGIVADPWKPGCVIASVGLVHMMPHGRLVEVCGRTVRQVYSRPYRYREVEGEEPRPYGEIAFYGLVSQDGRLWAAAMDGLYRFDREGEPTVQPLPKFRDVGGVRVSFDVPGLVLVLTDINARTSLSGSVPMMVAR
jgi:hypothetical protein